ncbi:MAG: hypothetical protein IJ400_03505 [Clostridia bacterium]|nr:hypothetical protein [Clostridia bacterium]
MIELDFISEIVKCTTSQEVYQILLKNGFETTKKEAAVLFFNIHQEGDLAKEELSNVGQGQRFPRD